MPAESNLLRVVLALQMGFVSKEQVIECGALWASDRSKSLRSIIEEKGYLTISLVKRSRTALKVIVDSL
jgi:hypothetical protein